MKLSTSVILCTRNRPDDLILCLQSLALQVELPNELIIVDSSNEPIFNLQKIQEVFAPKIFPSTKLIYKHSTPGLTLQRNIGISLATQEIIYFFDDDTIIEPDYIKNMQAVFEASPAYAGGMGAITNLDPKKNNWHRLLRKIFLLQSDYASGNFTASGFPTHPYGTTAFKNIEVLGGCCMAFRASILAQHKFDEKLTRYAYMEDCDIARRISYTSPLFFNPQARLQHLSSPLARDAVIDNRAMLIKNYSYLFFKNFYPRNKFKIFAYSWSVFGLFVEAVLLRDKNYIRGYIKGLREYYRS